MVRTFNINGDRLLQSIAELAAIGSLPQGGVRRIAYTPEDIQGRNLVKQWMQDAGMSLRIDPAGNIIGVYAGKMPQLPVLATGSHIDTVPSGGRYDGTLGVLAGLEVVRTLRDKNLQFNHSLEVIVFTDEESSTIGSKGMSGNLVRDANYYRRPDGSDIQTCLKRVGGNWDEIEIAKRDEKAIAAFVELHVEQGPVLESMQKEIGIIEGIVGQRRFKILVEGSANHAGTTPMSMRRDALVAASRVVLAVNAIGNTPGQQVATVGQFQVYPNAANVVPGNVEMSLDLRDLSSRHIDRLLQQLRLYLEEIAIATATKIQILPRLHLEPALTEPHIQQAIARSCEKRNFTYTYLPSRASHDAQEMASITDMGMIFVPSSGGISHAETEHTSPEECVRGANILLDTLWQLDRYYK
ncbi:Zn-dependent hydrolase [Spirulina sp. 06S082]|uniref:Zn-dependent hydrolase n=1 Tax=Spirulina sp. 06S082 TaxID=3110248 RepID=UPI002B1F90F0|nr:Zn-dependent hydrolase [Spirulina sp. 06S082]MEA5468451.1 Zn-dependent hydrolase [Spirulina sp. 06S082]